MNKQQFMFTLSQNLKPLGQAAVQDILADFDDHFRNGLDAGHSEDEIANELGSPAEIARQYLDESADILTAAAPADPKAALPADPKAATPAVPSLNVATTHAVYPGTGSTQPTATASAQPTATAFAQPTATAFAQPAAAATQPAATTSAQPKGTTSHDGTLIAVILLNIFIGVPIWIALFATLSGFWAAAAGIGVTACVLFALAIFETGITSLILVLFGLAQTALTILAIILMVYLTKWLINGLRAYVRWNRNLVRGGANL